MTADDIRSVLLVRAVEESGAAEALLSDRERAAAWEAASERELPLEEAVVIRARRLTRVLGERVPHLGRLTRAGATQRVVMVVFVLGMLLLGAGVDLLGGTRAQLLQAPLLAIIGINLLLYLLLILRRVVRRGPALAGPLAALFAAGTRTWDRLRLVAGLKEEVAARFLALWVQAARPLLTAWAVRALHLGALGFVLGAVASMYLRGVASEFRITWESTFLDAGQVEALLRVALAPGLALLGWPPEPIASLQAPASGPAAHWIHLYAISAAAFVALPRLALALAAHLRARGLARELPLDLSSAYYLRLLSPLRGGATAVHLIGYSYGITPRTRDHLGVLIRSLLGEQASVVETQQLDYGDPLAVPDERALVLLFSLAQTPEAEVHGALVAEASQRALPPLVLVDGGPHAARFAGGADHEALREKRQRTWDRTLGEAGLTPLHLDLTGPVDDATLERGAALLAANRSADR